MKRSPVIVVVFVTLVVAVGRAAAEPPVAVLGTKAAWKAEDVVNIESATDFQIAPDGRHVVWVRSRPDHDKGEHVAHLVRSSLTGEDEVELTRGQDDCTDPRWSPDGKRIAFLSARPAPKAKAARRSGDDKEPKTQLWLMNAFGGEPWPLTDGRRDVTAFAWAGDEAIIFAAQEEPTLRETTAEEKKDTSIVVDDEAAAPPVRLFKISVDSKKVVRLTDNCDRIQWLALSPDGRKAVTVHERSLRYTYDNSVKPVAFLHDLETGERRQVLKDPRLNVRHVRWAADGRGFYAASDFTTHPKYLMASIAELYFHDLTTGQETRVALDWERGLSFEFDDGALLAGFHPTSDGFLAFLADGVRNRLARYRKSGDKWEREWIQSEHQGQIFGLTLGGDGKTLVYARCSASTPTQWYRASLDGGRIVAPVRFTDLNADLKDKPLARTEVVRWKGARDEEVEGLLYYPHGYERGQRYPLVVMIHGGPLAADLDTFSESWAYPANLMCQRGAFVLKPNYHGSANYGLKFAESIGGGNYYDLEVPDIEKGVDHLIARGLVDADKLGVLGWSNGGILTTALTVTTTRYKVAASGAGDVEWVSDWGMCEFGAAFDNFYLGKSPLEDPDLYRRKSPFYRLDKVVTPTIIFFGSDDRQVPTQQGWLHYRALQQLGKVPVRFLLFPDEKHSLHKLAHQKRKLQEELAWFDKYLFKREEVENPSLKPDSPLARLLKLRGVKRDAGRYGVVEKGVLVPETVRHDGLQVGRFEVTQAQYAEFDRSSAVPAGRENFPAHGVSFDKAKAYCDWLSQRTGRTYRLPSTEEAEELYGEPDEEDNTLDAWAGYAVNPEDATRLREQVKELGTALLKEVGSGKGAGAEELVFDLGGNVAEWVVAADGKGQVRGGSADTPRDARIGARKPWPDYVGFRVVEGPVKKDEKR